MKTIAIVAGARPNFMKIAPIVRALRKQGGDLAFAIIHTGQHYDRETNDVFFEELGIPLGDTNPAAAFHWRTARRTARAATRLPA
jgi:UDP-N-acetylglucosamine 2-epimerase (non-hydrolysing)